MIFQAGVQATQKDDLSQKLPLSWVQTYENGHVNNTCQGNVHKPESKAGYSAAELWQNGKKLIGCTARGNDLVVTTGFGREDIIKDALAKDSGASFKITIVDGKNARLEVFSYSRATLLVRDNIGLDLQTSDMRKLQVWRYDNYGSMEPKMTDKQKKDQRYVNENQFVQFYKGAKDEIARQAENIGIEEANARLIVGGTGLALFSTLVYFRSNATYFVGKFYGHKNYAGRAAMPDYALKVNAELDKALNNIIFNSKSPDFREHMNNICQTQAQKTEFLNYVKSNLLRTMYEPGSEAEFNNQAHDKLSTPKNKKGSKPLNDIKSSHPQSMEKDISGYKWRKIPGFRNKGKIFTKLRGIDFMNERLPGAIFTSLNEYKAANPGMTGQVEEAQKAAITKGGADTPKHEMHKFADARMNGQLKTEVKALYKNMKKMWRAEFNHQMWVDLKGVLGTGILPVQYTEIVKRHLKAGDMAFWAKMHKEGIISDIELKTFAQGKYESWKDVIKSTDKQAAIVKRVTKISGIYKDWKAGKSGSYKLLMKELGYATYEKMKPGGKISMNEVPPEKFGIKGLYTKNMAGQVIVLAATAFLMYEFSSLFSSSDKQEKKTGVVFTGKTADRVISTIPVHTDEMKLEPTLNAKNGSYVYTAWITKPSVTDGGTMYNQARFEGITKSGTRLFSAKINANGTMSTAVKGFGEMTSSGNSIGGITGASFMLFLNPSQKTAVLAAYTSMGEQLNKVQIEWNPAFDDPQKLLIVNKSYKPQK